jgi:hypothetical protein
MSEHWADYREQAIELQAQLREVEKKIGVYWTAALDAADGDKRAAWFATPVGKEDTAEGYEFSSLKGERVLLLQKIQAAATMSMMLYQQSEDVNG